MLDSDKNTNKKRLPVLDLAKGLVILLVVLGHIVAKDVPQGNEWYFWLKAALYKFHMPFFMFISGFVFYYNYKPVENFHDYAEIIKKKAMRLIPAYLIVGIFVLFSKMLAENILYIDKPMVGGFAVNLLAIFIAPKLSVATFLWYLYALMGVYLLFPLLHRLVNGNTSVLFLLGIIFYFLPINTDYFSLSDIFKFFVFAAAGALACDHYEKFTAIIYKFFWQLVIVFIVALIASLLSPLIPKLITGLASIPVLLGLISRAKMGRLQKSLLFLGQNTLAIYLFNTICIGFVKALLLKIAPWDGLNFLWFAPILMISGVTIPLAIKHYIFPKARWLR